MNNSDANSAPLISIIMPTYNQSKYITETIESIRQQSYTNWELIIVDDGSDDMTEMIINSFDDEKIVFIKAGRINVAGIIKNIGLAKAEGEFIAFIDSDDLWEPGKLEKQIIALRNNPEAEFCVTGGYNFKKINQPFEYYYKQRTGYLSGELFIPLLKSEVSGFIQALLFRKTCLDKTGLFKTDKPFSDINFIVSIAYHFKGIILYEPLLKRRLHETNHSSANWLLNHSNAIDMINAYRDKIPNAIRKEVLFKMYMNAGEGHLRRNQKINAILKFVKAWIYKPMTLVAMKKIAKAIVK